ncbi:hypothetical protein [Proteus mirabilis]|uniref:hypothetical protein n=1 Tax=Proteus mirabilis TaxID=584 RepID=UPI0034DD0DEF
MLKRHHPLGLSQVPVSIGIPCSAPLKSLYRAKNISFYGQRGGHTNTVENQWVTGWPE